MRPGKTPVSLLVCRPSTLDSAPDGEWEPLTGPSLSAEGNRLATLHIRVGCYWLDGRGAEGAVGLEAGEEESMSPYGGAAGLIRWRAREERRRVRVRGVRFGEAGDYRVRMVLGGGTLTRDGACRL